MSFGKKVQLRGRVGKMLEFYKNKKVFLTGHTGFKGSWLSKILIDAGAELTGYSLAPPTEPALFNILGIHKDMRSVIGDIRDFSKLFEVFEASSPEIVFHLAAQPLVLDSYQNPLYTYETNVMGTVNILECVRRCGSVRSFLNVTTDKVYNNQEWFWGYRENDRLGGFDPYSNSKACSELVTESYKCSFFNNSGVAVSTARAGNVIGGGDFAVNRIIPDCVRASLKNENIIVRNPHSIRPYQHVLEPLSAYLTVAKAQCGDKDLAGSYNVGPHDGDCVTTGKLTDIFCKYWGGGASWENKSTGGPHEATFLKLDCSKINRVFGWRPLWDIGQAVEKTVEWVKIYESKEDIEKFTATQINEYFTDGK